jgi:spermidine synthase
VRPEGAGAPIDDPQQWQPCGRERAPNGGELCLYQRGDEFVIRVGSHDLMWSGSSHSERELARITLRRLGPREKPRILVGGLGMGFTARAALDALPEDGRVVVAEIAPAVVVWNRGPLGHLADHPLDDPRLTVELGDVAAVISTTRERFDAILLDVDNGPKGLTRKANQQLYGAAGLGNARRALRPGGLLAVWSASPSPPFEEQVRRAKLELSTVRVRARGEDGGRTHFIFLGRNPDLG